MISDSEELNASILNSDIAKIQQWAKQWLVTFNAEKTNSMPIASNVEPPVHHLYMYDRQIENVTHSLHLGVTLQHNLKWDKHIENSCLKAHKRLDIINSLSLKLSRRTLETLYKSYVRSILEYADVLFTNTTQDNIEKLNKVQKRAGKIVSGAIRGTPSDILYGELDWESLDKRRERRMLLLYSDIIHDRAPSYLHTHIPQTVQERTQGRYNLRNQNDLTQPVFRTETHRKSYFPTMASTWNTTDPAIKSIQSKTTLKTTLKNNCKPNPYFYLGNRRLNITLARIRMNCSQLNSHLFAMHIIPDPNCQCGQLESTTHYFVDCPLYTLHRMRLSNQLGHLGLDFNVETILHGTSDPITDLLLIEHVGEFMNATTRFSLISGTD